MIIYQKKIKIILWSILLLLQIIPVFIKVNVSIQLFFNSVILVYLGCLHAICIAENNIRKAEESEDDKGMQMSDVYKFPIQASLSLLSLYVLLENLDPTLLSMFFKIIFGGLGTICIGELIIDDLFNLFTQKRNKVLKKKILFKFLKFSHELTVEQILSYLIGMVISIIYVITNHWTFSNILAISFTISAIKSVKIGSFNVIVLLLWVLFFYDIFWVFGSDVMVKVATKFDVPIKIIFALENGKKSILGLGDIVLPGFLIGLALKYDVDKGLEERRAKAKKTDSSALFENKLSLFNGTITGYIVGIITTMAGLHIMGRAQPALLYLVPSCTIGLIIPVILNKEIKKVFFYDSTKRDNVENV